MSVSPSWTDDGMSLMKKFVIERFESENEASKDFHDSIKKLETENFQGHTQTNTDYHWPTKEKCGRLSWNCLSAGSFTFQSSTGRGSERSLKPSYECNTFGHFNEDGTRRKTTKSDLLHELEAASISVYNLTLEPPDDLTTVYVNDAMSLLQKMNTKNFKNFNEVGRSLMDFVNKLLLVALEVHIVFDRYDDRNSTKYEERVSRKTSSGHRYEISEMRPIPDWKQIMELDINKAHSTNFLSL